MKRIIYFQGGLGNQMFLHAFYRFLQSKGESNLEICIASPSLNRHNGFDLFRAFPNIEKNKPAIITSFLKNNYYNLIFLLRNQINFSCRTLLFENIKNPIDTEHFLLQKETLLMGFWQDKYYSSAVTQILRNDFTFYPFDDFKNIEICGKIEQAENPVSIHIRRGDYMQANLQGIYGNICTLDYYDKAIKKIQTMVANPSFFVFSDDPEWVKDNLLLEDACYISHNKGLNAFRDMQLMSCCKHHIIANSSFSWWGAWLNAHPEKIVLTPSKWYNIEIDKTIDRILPETWIRVD